MTVEELKQYRIQLFRDASSMKKEPDRTPHFSSFGLWRAIHYGYRIDEVLNDYDKLGQTVRWFADNFKFDGMTNFGGRNPIRIPNALGESVYVVDADKEMLGVKAYQLCDTAELKEMIADVNKFCWEKLLSRRYSAFRPGMGPEVMQKPLDEMFKFQAYNKKIGTIMREEYGFPAFTPPQYGYVLLGVEFLFAMVRGIRGMSLDMRRDPGLVKAACDAYDDVYLAPMMRQMEALPNGPDMGYCFDFGVTMLAHTVMNQKQWEQIYWPTLKMILDTCQKKEKTIRITIEGSIDRFHEYLADYPKGMITLAIEQDDIFEMHKKLPNCAMMGGMQTELLGSATEQECVDYARKLIDELGPWYIMGQNKFPTYRSDATPENLRAVCDFVQSYRP